MSIELAALGHNSTVGQQLNQMLLAPRSTSLKTFFQINHLE